MDCRPPWPHAAFTGACACIHNAVWGSYHLRRFLFVSAEGSRAGLERTAQPRHGTNRRLSAALPRADTYEEKSVRRRDPVHALFSVS